MQSGPGRLDWRFAPPGVGTRSTGVAAFSLKVWRDRFETDSKRFWVLHGAPVSPNDIDESSGYRQTTRPGRRQHRTHRAARCDKGEVEQAFANAPLVALAEQKRGGEDPPLCVGLTDEGRAIQFVYTIRCGESGSVRAHTATRRSDYESEKD